MLALTKIFRQNRKIIILIAAPTLFLFLSSFYKKGDSTIEIGDSMPSAKLNMVSASGDTVNLSQLVDENGLIVVFSCNTCPFVVGNDNFAGWEEQYNSIYEAADEVKVGMVLVNSNAAKRSGVDSQAEMLTHSTDESYLMKYLIDKDAVVADAFGAKTTPHVFVFDGNKKLIYKGSIDDSWNSKRKEDHPYLMDVINSIAAETEIKNNSTSPKGCSIKRTTN